MNATAARTALAAAHVATALDAAEQIYSGMIRLNAAYTDAETDSAELFETLNDAYPFRQGGSLEEITANVANLVGVLRTATAPADIDQTPAARVLGTIRGMFPVTARAWMPATPVDVYAITVSAPITVTTSTGHAETADPGHYVLTVAESNGYPMASAFDTAEEMRAHVAFIAD